MRTAAICPTCATYTNAVCVIYDGPDVLTNINVNPLDSLDLALVNINTAIGVINTSIANLNLDQVLTNGNTSQLDAKVGTLGLYDGPNGDYGKVSLSDSIFDVTDVANNSMIRVEADTFTLANKANIGAGLVTTPKTFILPNKNGTFAMTSDIPSNLITGTGVNGQVAFWTGTGTQSGSNNLFWDNATGALGINTPAPSAKLDVGGNVKITNSVDTTALNIVDNAPTNASDEVIKFTSNLNGFKRIVGTNLSSGVGASVGAIFYNNANDYFQIYQAGSANTDILGIGGGGIVRARGNGLALLSDNTTNSSIRFYTYNKTSERMRITSSGYVGIGTTTPSRLLDVNGDASINGVRVGRGSGDIATNTVVGSAALDNNVTGSGITAIGVNALGKNTGSLNTALGASAGSEITTGAGNTVIGANNNTKPGNGSLETESGILSLSSQGSPEIWAQNVLINISSGNTESIIDIDVRTYAGAVIDYSVQDQGGSQQTGTIWAAFDCFGSVSYSDNKTPVTQGGTLSFNLTIQNNSSYVTLQLENNSPYDYNCVCIINCRLLKRYFLCEL